MNIRDAFIKDGLTNNISELAHLVYSQAEDFAREKEESGMSRDEAEYHKEYINLMFKYEILVEVQKAIDIHPYFGEKDRKRRLTGLIKDMVKML